MNATAVPAAFREALLSLQGARTRRDVRLVETPAPSRIAPFAVAINGTVLPEDLETTGRFVALHDPAGQDAWNGTFRVVALVQARVEAEVGQDDLWADAAWSWLNEALSDVPHEHFGGTVTKVVSRSFGQLARNEDDVTVELRVSWTPTDSDLAPHIVAWTELLAMCAGVPPAPQGVSVLPGGHR
ncbi:DUF3000 domain-containing protein [Demequina sp. TTPB684]|uniref:DUF3000 domain-containing protein n=1 Tax=unclassified Demequina TaxID=2620311 RepID=UPI001CF336F2|nr:MULTISPECIES: DUF3000 domain-containing protein [unclassified Demequina]MCB2414101.1 DUF3000 domain-containing protein [Demequina sp. TTPB684]UPU89188.1 DUF3000 domain-containing protein [Demequina sp. TMPB413]